MILGIITILFWEARQVDVDMANLEADVKKEIYIKLPEAYCETRSHVGFLKRPMYGLLW